MTFLKILSIAIAWLATVASASAAETSGSSLQYFKGHVGVVSDLFRSSATDGDEGRDSERHSHSALDLHVDSEVDFGADNALRLEVTARSYNGSGVADAGDVRQAQWLRYGDKLDWRVGILQEAWGVLEGGSLVDIVNQRDAEHDYKLTSRLGQLGAVLSKQANAGVFEFFALTQSRQRRFPEAGSHFSVTPLRIDYSSTQYESSKGDNNLDWAVRGKHYFGSAEIAASYFRGNSREPLLNPVNDELSPPRLIPYYASIRQLGLEGLYTGDHTVWKFETLYRQQEQEDFAAIGLGAERRFNRLFQTKLSLDVFLEVVHDDRTEKSPAAIYDRDVFVGARLALNDFSSTELQAQLLHDRDSHATIARLQFSRRLGRSWWLQLELDALQNTTADRVLNNYEDHDRLRLELRYLF